MGRVTPSERFTRMARYGPFFTVDAVGAEVWLPLSVQADRQLMDDRAHRVSSALAGSAPAPVDVPGRVAASITQLGLVARLTAVALAAEVEDVPLPGSDRWWWQDRIGGPYPLAIDPGEPTNVPWPERLLDLVGPVTRAVVDRHSLSPQIAWGNVASGLAGAAHMIGAVDPTAVVRAAALLDAALGTAALTGTGTYAGGRFRRRSCCLIYRLAHPPTYCGDCVLAS